MKSLPAVYELTLHHNPWHCDCGLRTFRKWMIEHRIPLSYSPNCTLPERLFGKSWNQLELDEFACPPIVVSIDTEVVVYEGRSKISFLSKNVMTNGKFCSKKFAKKKLISLFIPLMLLLLLLYSC